MVIAENYICAEDYSYGNENGYAESEQRRRCLLKRFDLSLQKKTGLVDKDTRVFFSSLSNCQEYGLQYIDYELVELSELAELRQDIEEETVERVYKRLGLALDNILKRGSSKWKVGHRCGYPGLEQRVIPMMQEAADQLKESSESYSSFLSKSWHCAFGIHPNYSDAYSNAIKAIEAKTTGIIAPNDKTATLSKIAKVMRDQNWHYSIESSYRATGRDGIIQELMSALMNNHVDRHGSSETKNITEKQACAAVFSAVFVIQAFQSNLVSRQE